VYRLIAIVEISCVENKITLKEHGVCSMPSLTFVKIFLSKLDGLDL